jgi:hypothetical protein
MKPMARTLAAVVYGFAAGLAVGPVSLLAANASDTWVRGWPWPKVDSKFVLLLLASSVPAGINGAVGAALAAGWGRRQRLDITVLPAGLHVAAAVLALIDMPYLFLFSQLLALMFSVVVWPAGRLGQMIGSTIRGRGPGPTAPIQGQQQTGGA